MAWATYSNADGTVYAISADMADPTTLLSQNLSQAPVPDGTTGGQFDVTQSPVVFIPSGN
jgi:hypothetical protein